MELWIRSQDKERLCKVVCIEYQEDDYGCYIFCWKDKYEGYRFGTYKTKERALEVLDEIQKRITMLALFSMSNDKLTNNVIDEIRDRSLIVYEMPEE